MSQHGSHGRPEYAPPTILKELAHVHDFHLLRQWLTRVVSRKLKSTRNRVDRDAEEQDPVYHGLPCIL